MNYDFKDIYFSRCLLAGLLAGLMAAVLDMIIFFCLASSDIGLDYSLVINPLTIFLGSIIPAVVAGLFYYFLSQIKGGNIMHVIIFSVLTILFAKKGLQIHSMNNQNVEKLFHQIIIAMIVIEGWSTAFMAPIICRNKTIQKVLF